MNYQIELLYRTSRVSYVVRPQGALGTCGWINGQAWQASFHRSLRAAQAHLLTLNAK